MGTQKPKRGCEVTEESGKRDINKTGYDEAPAKYMANPEKGFWETIRLLFKKKER